MKMKTMFKAAVIALLAVTVLFSQKVYAVENAAFEKSKYVLYEGNEEKLVLTYGDEEDFFSDWFLYDYGYYTLKSSNENVATVDYQGNLRCIAPGKTVITFTCGNVSASTKITVKSSGCTLSRDNITVYVGEEVSVRLKNKKHKAAGYDYEIMGPDSLPVWKGNLSIGFDDAGKYTFYGGEPGEYIIEYILYDGDGRRFSTRGRITVLPCGPELKNIAVAKGDSVEFNLVNANLVSVKPWYWENADGEDISYIEGEDILPSFFDTDTMEISGVFAGKTVYYVEYTTPSGVSAAATVYVFTTEPKYNPSEDYAWGGEWFELGIEGACYCSDIEVTPADSEACDVKTENGKAYIMPLKSGAHVIYISVDGVEFDDAIECVVLSAPKNVIRIAKGKSYNVNIGDIPDGLKVKYTTDNKKIATVSKKGKVTGKGYGVAIITAKVGTKSVNFAVNVGTPVGIAAVKYAEKQIGKAEYSQAKRMEDGYFDCSSLAWRSFASQECYLGGTKTYAPTAADLAKWMKDNGYEINCYGIPEDLSTLVAGDLIFSTSGGNNGRFMNIDHVAVYTGAITGSQSGSPYMYYDENELIGLIVHAGSSGGGVYTSWYPGYGNIRLVARPKTD